MEGVLGKRYKLESSENFEEYLKFLEVGFFHRKAGLAASPVSSLVRNPDGSYTFTMYTTLRNTTITFRPGEELVEERADGVKVRTVMEIEGNKLIQTQTEQNGRKSTHVREFTPETLTVTTTADGWDGKAVRTYRVLLDCIPEKTHIVKATGTTPSFKKNDDGSIQYIVIKDGAEVFNQKWTPGQETEFTTPYGTTAKNLVTLKDNAIEAVITYPDGSKLNIHRLFEGNTMKLVVWKDGVDIKGIIHYEAV